MNNSSLIGKKVMATVFSFLYKVFRYLLLLGISYIVLFPVLKMIFSSLTTPEELFSDGSGFLPSTPTFENFINSQSYFKYFKHAGITVYISVVSTVLQLIVCSLVGYGLGRYKFKGNGIVYAAVLFTVIMPIQTALIPLIYEYRWFNFFGIGKLIGLITGKTLTVNLLNHYLTYFVPALFGVGLNSGIFIFLFRQFFASMPKDLEEAAKLDGCNPFMIYLRVMIPNIMPVLVTVALLSMIYYWQDSMIAGISNLSAGAPLMLELERLVELGLGSMELDLMRLNAERYALMLLAILPLMIVFIIGQRFFVECMDRSGSKG